MTWLVEVDGYAPVEVEAPSVGKARYRAWLRFHNAFGGSFYAFLARGVKVSRACNTNHWETR